MPTTRDRFPGSREEEELLFEDNADGDPAVAGGMKYDAGSFRLRDAQGVIDPRTVISIAASGPGQVVVSGDDGVFVVACLVISDKGDTSVNNAGHLTVELP